MTSGLRLVLLVSLVFMGHSAFAVDALKNCYESPSRAQFFVHELEEIAQEGATAVLLLNAKKQVVGVISVSPKRNTNGQTSTVTVNKVELCSSLEASDFYYTEGVAENLLTWVGAKKDDVQITQDEGLLVVNATEVQKDTYATMVRAEYKAYDVFNEDENVNSPANRRKADHIDDWGTPRAKGVFFYSIPKNWSVK